jgi:hypothetical protein
MKLGKWNPTEIIKHYNRTDTYCLAMARIDFFSNSYARLILSNSSTLDLLFNDYLPFYFRSEGNLLLIQGGAKSACRKGPVHRAKITHATRVAVAIQFNTDRQDQLKREVVGYLNDHLMRIIVSKVTGKKFDDPLVPRQVVVDPTIYNAFVCEYQLAPKMILTIKKDGNRLIAQITGQKSAEIFPASET